MLAHRMDCVRRCIGLRKREGAPSRKCCSGRAPTSKRKIKKALSTPEARAKVLADPKKLPTVKAGERWICQWEQLGLPCAPLGSEHFERNAHKVCAYCLVIGHPLVRCELATKDGVDVAGINAVAGSPQGGLVRGAGGAGKRRT